MNRARLVTELDKFYVRLVLNFSGWNSSTPAGLIKRPEIVIEMLNGWANAAPATLGRGNIAQHTYGASDTMQYSCVTDDGNHDMDSV